MYNVDVLCAQSETLSNTALETCFLKKIFSSKWFCSLLSSVLSLVLRLSTAAVTHFINLELLIAHE